MPLEIAGLVGCAVTTGICAVWRSAEVRPGQRAAVIGCGGVGLSAVIGLAAVGAAPIVAVDVDDAKLEAALSLGATDAVAGPARRRRPREEVQRTTGGGVDVAVEATGRSEAMLTAFLSTRRRGTAVFIGIPRADAVVPLPALSIPRMERRVIGALYGSARPDRDFLVILDQYRRGRLPLDRLVSHRLPLDEIERGVRAAAQRIVAADGARPDGGSRDARPGSDRRLRRRGMVGRRAGRQPYQRGAGPSRLSDRRRGG